MVRIDRHAAGFAVILIGHAGIGVPEKPPSVLRVSPAALCAVLNKEATCGIKGMELADAVLYSNELDFTNPQDSAILIHEYVHYLQWVRKGLGKTCEERAAREDYAYKIQAEVLGKLDYYFARPIRMTCD